jgi:hypothetical protein
VHKQLTVIAAAFLIGCATADVLVLDPSPRTATHPDSVAVLLEEPKQAYRPIALIEVSDQAWGMSLESLAKKMRTEAAKRGGDAVIIGSKTTEGSTVIVPIGNTWYAGTEKKLVGKVIVFVRSQQ